MKNIVSIVGAILCLLFSESVFGQVIPPRVPKSHLKELALKANVKSFKVTTYKAIDSFGIVKRGSKADFWKGDIVSFFDREGYKTEMNYYDKDANLNQKILYKYNDKRKRTTRDVYASNGKLINRNIYFYDENGYKVAYKGYNSKGEIMESFVYKNDDKGRELEEVCAKTIAPFCGKYTYVYDQSGKVVELCRYKSSDKKAEDCEKYVYDKLGNLLETSFYKDNNLVYRIVHRYNKSGDEVNQRLFDERGNLTKEKKFTYKYDAKGNWIERTEFVDEFVKFVFVREISYH
ncbi:sugar-binding protein [Capnocytophaga canimorsus]|uniref:Sugar-binding protein n=1 Tax=Capnocytophaga canimorsus TaxID=28188 RepID=A0AAC9Z3F8_9FLAO|nr:sugar-binding protein [Capnocytophaga canimorsus]ATA94069.1 sugar-binding protein [Capnocytophaga canimorsus]